MDICVLNPFFHPYAGGTEKALLNVYGRLSRRHNITVISSALEPGDSAVTEEMEGIKVIRLKTHYTNLSGLPLPFMRVEGLPAAIAAQNADIYHINNRFVYYSGALNAIRRTKARLALTIHNSLPQNIDLPTDLFGLAYDTLWTRRIIHASDVITGVSRNAIDVTIPRRYWDKSHVIFNGVDFRLFTPRPKSDGNVRRIASRLGLRGRIILTNGRLVPQKGQVYLIRAVAHMRRDQHGGPSLLIIGRGPLERYLYGQAASLGLKGRFSIVSNLQEKELPYYYNAADVFAFPSLYEPAGITITEALACEIPSVAARIGGIPEMVKECGLYFNPRSPREIRRSIEAMLGNERTAVSMARAGRRLMVKEHDWNKIAVQYEKLFLETIRY